jgi:hypothetical protein
LKVITINKLYFIHINRKMLDKEKKVVRITHIANLKKTDEVELEDVMTSLKNLRPQNTVMEGAKGAEGEKSEEEDNTIKEDAQGTQNGKNDNGKRPCEDLIDEAL